MDITSFQHPVMQSQMRLILLTSLDEYYFTGVYLLILKNVGLERPCDID